MTRIDLIPPELVERERARRIIALMTVIFVVVLFAIAFLTGLSYLQRAMVTGRLQTLRVEKAKVDREVEKLKVYEERKNLLTSREKILTGITKDEIFWSSILNSISMVIPSDVWLKTFKGDVSAALQAKGGQAGAAPTTTTPAITITGVTFSHSAVARWLVRLSEINQFRSIWLVSSEEKEIGTTGQKQIEFNTTATLTQFAKKKGKEAKAP